MEDANVGANAWVGASNEQLKTSDYSSGNSETSSDSGPDPPRVDVVRKDNEIDAIIVYTRLCADGSKLYTCPHCPFATKIAARFPVHLKNHENQPPLSLKNPRRSAAAIMAENNKKKPRKCPFCSYMNSCTPSLHKHVQMHFNFKYFLKMRGLEVSYDRQWANGDTVEVRTEDKDDKATKNHEP